MNKRLKTALIAGSSQVLGAGRRIRMWLRLSAPRTRRSRLARRIQAVVESVAQSLFARVVVQMGAQPVHRVGERNLAHWIGEGKGAAGTGVPEGAGTGSEVKRLGRA